MNKCVKIMIIFTIRSLSTEYGKILVLFNTKYDKNLHKFLFINFSSKHVIGAKCVKVETYRWVT